MKKLIILGAGGYGRTVADVAEQLGYTVSFLDDKAEAAIDICENFVNYIGDNTWFYPAFGNNESRMAWLQRLMEMGCNIPKLIHTTAYVSPKAVVLPGTVVLPRAVVNTGTTVKAGCIINCRAIIDHDCVIDEGVHVCLGAIVKADNHIPSCLKIEAGAIIENRTYA